MLTAFHDVDFHLVNDQTEHVDVRLTGTLTCGTVQVALYTPGDLAAFAYLYPSKEQVAELLEW